MKNINIIKACSDLGVHIDGSNSGPNAILNNMNLTNINQVLELHKPNCIKEFQKDNKKKNMSHINNFNNNLYNLVYNSINNGNLPITLGGDHSIAIGSALGSIKKYDNLGCIWIDSHADFNTFSTTPSGNIHGLPFATITGQNGNDLSEFHSGSFYNPKNSVLVGARSIDFPGEYNNLEKAGVTIFTTEDIKKHGMQNIMSQAIHIATDNTFGMHISIDIDVLDPKEAPGVSVPEINGINKFELMQAIDELILNKNLVKSIDLVEYNPTFDINNFTLEISQRILQKLITLK